MGVILHLYFAPLGDTFTPKDWGVGLHPLLFQGCIYAPHKWPVAQRPAFLGGHPSTNQLLTGMAVTYLK